MTDLAQAPSLYVHVPFCAQKCNYCAFYSHEIAPGVLDRYVQCLLKEVRSAGIGKLPQTIFFGGGTPTLLTLKHWESVLGEFHNLGLAGGEWTVECNPATVSSDKAKLLRAGGVNRISMGVQSMEPALLERLGRVHTREMVLRSYEILRSAGFDNINLDLMFGIPGQTMADWASTLRQVIELEPEHLSSYEVIYEEDTPLYEQLRAGQFAVDEELNCAMYEALVEHADNAGLVQYEVANFARSSSADVRHIPERACRHNINYWRGGEYHGLGPSASAHLDGCRSKNKSNTTIYCEQLENGIQPLEWSEQLNDLESAGETAAFGLRMNAGWPFELFQQRTGYSLMTEWKDEANELIRNGWAVMEPDRFRLNREGLRFADSAARLLLRSNGKTANR